MTKYALVILMLCLAFFALAQEIPIKSYNTAKLESPIQIDGLLNDKAWEQVEWGSDFTQIRPDQGESPAQRTAFKILYDEKNLYVAIRAFDTEPEKIVKRMSRRDGFEGDWVEINIDSYHDKRTAFSFTASVTGVKSDEYVSNNGNNWDSNWDPIWYLKTSIDDKGWIAEFRIPLSQLRFADKEEHVWGLQINRRFFREEERSSWQFIPPDKPGWVYLFGELRGLKGIKPQKQLEVQPYILAKAETFEKEEGNPFADGSTSDVNVGIDAKVGITSDITLDVTINPDFGQVEADPSQVNLSAFQLFFREQRPFFIEGNNILDFRVTRSEAGGPYGNDNLFYSRRIGRRPSYQPSSLEDTIYVNQPRNTSILGAAKVTGKNKNGFSWGILEAVTQRQFATLDSLGVRSKEAVEPFTNYFVGRAQQDLNGGETVFGAMFTATNRNLRDDHLNFLHRNAYSAGVDLLHNFAERKYYVSFRGVYSNVNGSEEAISDTQLSSERFYQRPDNNHQEYDSTLTSLTGTGATLNFGKNSGNLVFQTGATYRSPGFETNDLGFLVQSDYITQYTWAGYRFLNPFSVFRSLRVNLNQWNSWDFGGVKTFTAFNTNFHSQFKNFWRLSMGSNRELEIISNADLRGGPSIKYPGSTNWWIWAQTDERKKFVVSYNQWFWWGDDSFGTGRGSNMNIRFQPTNALRVSFRPSFSSSSNALQYVTTFEGESGDDYILANVNNTRYSASFRVNYNFTPNLSLQYWGQPFIARVEYDSFKKVTNPSSESYSDRFHQYSGDQITFTDIYEIDENMDGSIDQTLDNPDFNFMQFRSNMVLRWEYIPGSTLFVVWTQDRTGSSGYDAENDFSHLYTDLFDVKPRNIFLLKYTYRFIK